MGVPHRRPGVVGQRVVFLVATLLLAGAAGCLGEARKPAARFDPPHGIVTGAHWGCSERAPDGTLWPVAGLRMPDQCTTHEDRLHIRNVTLQTVDRGRLGLLVQPFPGDILLENITLVGFQAGIHIDQTRNAFVSLKRNITIQNAWVESAPPMAGDATGAQLAGILVSAPWSSNVHIRNVTIRGFPQGLRVEGAHGTNPDSGGYFQEPIPSTTIERAEVDCRDEGVVLRGEMWNDVPVPVASVSRSNISGCQWAGIHARTPIVHVVASRIERSGTGIHSVHKNRAAEELRVELSTLRANGLGIRCEKARVAFTGLRLQDNGMESSPRPFLGQGRGGLSGSGCSGSLSTSRVEGNAPFGVSWDGTMTLEAMENWWGSPHGPRVAVSGPGPVGPGGDSVTPFSVRFVPWRSAPP